MGNDRLSTHIGTLDAVRGVAALVVVIHHYASFLIDHEAPTGVLRYVLKLLWVLGHPAVVVFFVLSGFVLYVGFCRARHFDLANYIARRILRIYPAYLVAIAICAALIVIIQPVNSDALGRYMQDVLPQINDAWSTARALFLVPAITGDERLNPVLWTLVHEVRFSLAFPVLALLCRRSPSAFLIGSIATYVVARYGLHQIGSNPHYFLGADAVESILISATYLATFALGMITAHRFLQKPVTFTPSREFAALAVFGLLAVLDMDDLATGLAACVVLLIASSDTFTRKVLQHPLLVTLGKISFSLYLIHFPILVFTSYLCEDLPLWAFSMVLALGVAVSIAAAIALNRLVEVPFHRLGSNLARRRDEAVI